MVCVYCLCGKIGSGKSTYAKKLQDDLKCIVFNTDDLMLPLFGENLEREVLIKKLTIVKNYFYGLADRILMHDISIVFDFGFWHRAERLNVRNRFRNRRVQFLYFPIDEKNQFSRISRRNNSPDKTYFFMEKMIRELNSIFEEPQDDEALDIKRIIEPDDEETQS